MRLRAVLRTLWTLWAAWLCAGPSPAAGLDTVGVDELDAGMRGFGLTVLEGDRIDTFQVEILGVQHGTRRPGHDLILARLSGLGLEHTGVIAGMSGSPVYVGGRLAGAVSMGWTFSTSPVCGITPIGEMLDVGRRDRTLEPGPQSRAYGATASAPARSPGSDPVPVWVSGAGPAASRLLRDLLGPLGMELVDTPATGGGAAGGAGGADLRPGAAVAVQLVRGDLNVAVIGTVTHVDGDRLLAFGHPLLPAGAVDMPLAAVRVFGVVPNQVSSFKVGAATVPLGAWRQDRLSALAGRLGAAAAMLPLQVAVVAPGDSAGYSFEIVRHPLFTTGLAQAAVLGSVESAARLLGDATLELRLDAQLDDGRTVSWRRVYSGADAALAAAVEAGEPLQALATPAFGDLHLRRLGARVAVRESIRQARIAAARLDRERAHPGETVLLTVRLAPYRDEERTLSVPIALPLDASSPLWFRVGSAAAALAWEDERLGSGPPSSSDDLIARLGRAGDADVLAVVVLSAEPGMAVDGRELPAPPPSVARLLNEAHAAGDAHPVGRRVVARARLPVDCVLTGEQTLRLAIDPRESR